MTLTWNAMLPPLICSSRGSFHRWFLLSLALHLMLMAGVQGCSAQIFGHDPAMALYQLEDPRIATMRCRCIQEVADQSPANQALVIDSVISWSLSCSGRTFRASARMAGKEWLSLVESKSKSRLKFGDRVYSMIRAQDGTLERAVLKDRRCVVHFEPNEHQDLTCVKSRLGLNRHSRRNIDPTTLVNAYRKELLLILPRCPR